MELEKKTEPKKAASAETGEINRIKDQVLELMNDFVNECENYGYETEQKRGHFIGGGFNNFQFMREAFDIGRSHPDLMPSHLNVSHFEGQISEIFELEFLNGFVKSFAEKVDTAFRYKTDKCFHEALAVYGFLEECERDKIHEATPLLKRLRTFYHHEKKKVSE
jgi:hypothetical protein